MEIPCGACVLPDGRVQLCMYAPNAQEVRVKFSSPDFIVPLQRGERGLWTAVTETPTAGMLTTEFFVDGQQRAQPDGADRLCGQQPRQLCQRAGGGI